MKDLNSITIYYINPNKFTKKQGYDDCCYSLTIPVNELDIIDSSNIRINKIYQELLEKDVQIYRIDMEYKDKTISCEKDRTFEVIYHDNYININF